jgi:peptidyl-tRNA hydrolase, PTH1 family
LKVVAGLGNPGSKYQGTRHNIGAMVACRLAEDHGIALKKSGYQALYGVGRVGGVEVTILLPQTFMNLSGASVSSACKSLGVAPGDLIVVHDEIEIPFGTLRIKVGGGHGGHNGLRSVNAVLGTGDYVRVRVGVGRPPQGADVAGYVLSRFTAAEQAALGDFLGAGRAAVETILLRDSAAAMNEFNNRDFVGRS